AVGLPLAILAGRIAALAPAIRAVYPLDPTLAAEPRAFIRYAALQFLYFGSWEVLFRGVLLFGLLAPLGAASSNVVQPLLPLSASPAAHSLPVTAIPPPGSPSARRTAHWSSIWRPLVCRPTRRITASRNRPSPRSRSR